VAWLQGVAGENDPSVGWYEGELWFFDNYIIPLAEKLSACGVFGVSYFECLNYAQANRAEWEQKGRDIVSRMLERCRSKYSPQRSKNADVEEEEIQFDTPSYCHTLGRSRPLFEVQPQPNALSSSCQFFGEPPYLASPVLEPGNPPPGVLSSRTVP
jgi:hypothetical protein